MSGSYLRKGTFVKEETDTDSRENMYSQVLANKSFEKDQSVPRSNQKSQSLGSND